MCTGRGTREPAALQELPREDVPEGGARRVSQAQTWGLGGSRTLSYFQDRTFSVWTLCGALLETHCIKAEREMIRCSLCIVIL